MKLPRTLSFQNSWMVRKASRPGRAQLVHLLEALDEGLKVSFFFMVDVDEGDGMWMIFFSKI